MKLSRKDWNNYVARLSAINKTAGRKMQAWINKHGMDDVEALVEVAYALATKYGEASSAVACQMYDEIAEIQKANVPPAVPKAPQHINYVNQAIRSTLDKAPSLVPSTVSELVKRTGAETTLKNAKRDGAYFAWVPNGDTCAFCMTLASNGWRKASKKTINGDHAEHIHKNCNCEFAISFNGPGQIEGYDPDKYLEMYEGAEGATWKDKVNSMRRAEYAANKDFINAQKRAAYARRTRTYLSPEYVGLKDEFVRKSVGARSRNYDIMDLATGEVYHLADGSKLQDKKVFAGKGTNVPYRKAQKYAERYGGRPEDWQHVKAIGVVHTEDGDFLAEIHWSQCDGIGKQEMFIKEWLE